METAERHQIRIARETLDLSDFGARIMGGPSKAEARRILDQARREYSAKDGGNGGQGERR